MLNIAICDDDENERTLLSSMVSRFLDSESIKAELSVFASPDDLIDTVENNKCFNLYLLDVLMPDMDGIALGMKLRKFDKASPIIYLTSSPDFAVASYDVKAFHYLLKPVSEEKLFEVLSKAVESLGDDAAKKILIRTKEGDVLLSTNDIYYVEQVSRTPYYITKTGRIRGLTLRTPFKDELSTLLADPRFYPCGASFLVNLSYIKAVEKTGVLFENGMRLTLPRLPLKELRIAWTNYWLESG